jgi:cytidylate kinase
MNQNSIAIDGPAGAGKSTLAKQLAAQLGYLYVDTGAIYRTVGLFASQHQIPPEEAGNVVPLLDEIHIQLIHGEDGRQHMVLNGADVTDQIRTPEISRYASKVSALPEVRAFLLEMQRELARTQDVVMDGRDIGTVVLPDAGVKIFLTASPETRANRRFLELQEKGTDTTFEEVLADIIARDEADRNRPIAPLKQAEDAVLADTSTLNLEESLQLLLRIAREGIGHGRA